MSKKYKYTYRFSEQTVDTRYYKVESNKKLTYHEMQDIAWSVEMTEGEHFEDDYTEEEVVFAALHHDLGKVGDLENDYYVPNDSKWHIENQGKYYKRGKDLNFMTVTDRAIYLLNHFGVTMTENEYLALRLTDGMYEEANKTYLMQYLDENKVKSNLPILLHQADMLASRIEYENWKHQDDVDVKPEPIKQVSKQEQKKVDGMKKAFDELFN